MISLDNPIAPQPVIWHIAYVMDCNLRCLYCSTCNGTYKSDRGYMHNDVWEKTIDCALAWVSKNQVLSFEFGVGETFLKFNEFLNMVDSLKKKAFQKQVEVNLQVCTNGTMLNEKKLKELSTRGISLTFSIDGPKSLHDMYRKDVNKKGTFDRVLRNLKTFQELSIKEALQPACNVQSVYTDNSSLDELIRFWSQQGVNLFSCMIQLPGFSRDKASITQWRNRQKHYLEELRAYAMSLAAQMIVPGFLSHYQGPQDIYLMWKRLFLENEHNPCGAGKSVVAVDINGDIYPCELFIGSKQWLIGNVFEGFEQKKLEQIDQCRTEAIAVCHDCDIKKVCPKSCLAENREAAMIDNLKSGCSFAKEIVDIAKESYSVLLANKRSYSV